MREFKKSTDFSSFSRPYSSASVSPQFTFVTPHLVEAAVAKEVDEERTDRRVEDMEAADAEEDRKSTV